jgi:hypothetical protein
MAHCSMSDAKPLSGLSHPRRMGPHISKSHLDRRASLVSVVNFSPPFRMSNAMPGSFLLLAPAGAGLSHPGRLALEFGLAGPSSAIPSWGFPLAPFL